jgi:hypothetical protein
LALGSDRKTILVKQCGMGSVIQIVNDELKNDVNILLKIVTPKCITVYHELISKVLISKLCCSHVRNETIFSKVCA